MYYKENGNLIPLKGTLYHGVNLYGFIIELKKKYNKGKISQNCIYKLEEIGMIWNLNEYKWELNYKEVENYYRENGHLNIPLRYVSNNGIRIGKWLQLQRIRYLKHKNSDELDLMWDEHFLKLEKLGIIWVPLEEQWNQYYYLAKKYYEEHGNLLISSNYITPCGIKLGIWINNQRKYYKKREDEDRNPNFTKHRIDLLEQIGMIWDVRSYIKEQSRIKEVNRRAARAFIKQERLDIIWDKYYKEAVKYYKSNGNLLVPLEYVVNGVGLGTWISAQRRNYKQGKLNSNQIDELEALGMIWNFSKTTWYNFYQYVKAFYLKNGNLSIPSGYVVDGYNLGNWINNQRQLYKKGKLTKEKEILLEELKIKWCVEEEVWLEKYNLYKEYIMKFGIQSVQINCMYKGVNLYNWERSQRDRKKSGKLEDYRIAKMEELGFSWDPLEEKWNQLYNLAKKYYEKYGDLLVPFSYEIDNLRLGAWIAIQRRNFKKKNTKNRNPKFTKERIELLEEIGMEWVLPSNYNKTSFEEQCIYFYVKKYYPDAINNYRVNGMELDIFVPSLFIAIEYDGEYWHKNKYAKDLTKNIECERNDIRLIRVREPKCKYIEGKYVEYRLKDHTNKTLQKKIVDLFLEQFHIKADIDIVRDMEQIMERYYARVDESWNEKYEYAKKYYEVNGNLLVPDKYVIDGVNLGNWIQIQRQAYKGNGKNRITKKHIDLLEGIGMIWNVKEYFWEKKYELAVLYYKRNGHLKIPSSYICKNVQLGRWIETQRQAYRGIHYKISLEQIEKLNCIGMIWYIK